MQAKVSVHLMHIDALNAGDWSSTTMTSACRNAETEEDGFVRNVRGCVICIALQPGTDGRLLFAT